MLLILALEMVLGQQFFKHDSKMGGSIVPVAFPMIAGAGSITTLLSLKAEFHIINIATALVLNMILVFLVLKATRFFERLIGPAGLAIMQKIFGVILLAIAIKLFISNTGIQLPNG